MKKLLSIVLLAMSLSMLAVEMPEAVKQTVLLHGTTDEVKSVEEFESVTGTVHFVTLRKDNHEMVLVIDSKGNLLEQTREQLIE